MIFLEDFDIENEITASVPHKINTPKSSGENSTTNVKSKYKVVQSSPNYFTTPNGVGKKDRKPNTELKNKLKALCSLQKKEFLDAMDDIDLLIKASIFDCKEGSFVHRRLNRMIPLVSTNVTKFEARSNDILQQIDRM